MLWDLPGWKSASSLLNSLSQHHNSWNASNQKILAKRYNNCHSLDHRSQANASINWDNPSNQPYTTKSLQANLNTVASASFQKYQRRVMWLSSGCSSSGHWASMCNIVAQPMGVNCLLHQIWTLCRSGLLYSRTLVATQYFMCPRSMRCVLHHPDGRNTAHSTLPKTNCCVRSFVPATEWRFLYQRASWLQLYRATCFQGKM